MKEGWWRDGRWHKGRVSFVDVSKLIHSIEETVCSYKRGRAAKESRCQEPSCSPLWWASSLVCPPANPGSHSVGPQQLSTFLFTNACGTPTADIGEKLHTISEMFANIVDEILKSF